MKINRLIVLPLLAAVLINKPNAQTTNFKNKPIKYTDSSFGGNFFIGNGIYNGNISDFFSNPIYIGINLEYYKKGIVIQFDDYIGFGKTKNTIEYSTEEIWDKNDFVLSGMMNLSLGYSIMDNDKIMIVTLSGLGFNKLSANLYELYDFGNSYKPTLPYAKFGCYLDLRIIRFFNNNPNFNSNTESYFCPKLSFGYTVPISKNNYPGFYDGNLIYLTIGFGGLEKIK